MVTDLCPKAAIIAAGQFLRAQTFPIHPQADLLLRITDLLYGLPLCFGVQKMMRAMRSWLVRPVVLAALAVPGIAFTAFVSPAPAQPQQVDAQTYPDEPGYEPTTSRGAPACPEMSRTLNSVRLLQLVDLPAVRRFYDSHGPECAWSTQNAEQVMDVIRASADHGLAPELFHAGTFDWSRSPASSDEATVRDVLLTDAALKYAKYVSGGLGWTAEKNPDDPADRLSAQEIMDGLMDALYTSSVREWMTGLAPQYPAYVQLQNALARYRQIAEHGGWEQLPASLSKARGRTRSGIEALRRRLHAEGDLASDNGSGRLDAELREGIIRFQWRNGLKTDGELTSKTIQRLNISVSERIASISLNLERLRISLRDMPATRVEVNLPAATAVLYRDGFAHLKMNVVVGAPKHETPELSSVIDSIVLNPQWNIPRSIIMNEIKPHIRRDPKYLKKNHMYWFKDQLIQEPGPWNALGQVKFDFPNPYAVYLHDTPSRQLFTDPERAASHGCVRLERPVDLAVELLRGNSDWDRGAVDSAINSGKTQRIRLQDPMPVVLSYQTAFADADGTVHFRTDIYGRDTQMTLSLANRVAAMGSAEPLQW